MKYIGPFLRINKLKKVNIKQQLFYLTKESLNKIVLYSKCGICTSLEELNVKKISNFDINTFKDLSPLLCIYKKASPKLINIDGKLCWNEDKFKKEINIDSNSYMTLCLLELCDYYDRFKNIDTNKYSLGKIYNSLCKSQLEFYATYLRNDKGVFVNKIVEDNIYDAEPKFEEKNEKFSFSSQALLMAAYYKCALLIDDGKESYMDFSLDILNMLIEYKEDLYELSTEDLTKLCFALNLFYKYSKSEACKLLLLDLSELLCEDSTYDVHTLTEKKIDHSCMKYMNYVLFYKNTGIIKFMEKAETLYKKLLSLYDPEEGIFIKELEDKDIKFSCSEIISYLLICLIHPHTDDDSNKSELMAADIFKHQVLDSGIILSWPDAPDLNDVERYQNFSLRPEDLIEEQNYRMPSIATPESCELAPVFAKYVTYNKKKKVFKDPKVSFDANKNLLIFFLIINFLKPEFDGMASPAENKECKDKPK